MGDLISYATSQSEYSNLLESDKFKLYSVTSYGAVGDGVTDDTDAIELTISTATSAGGGIIFFPRGTYYIATTITIPTNIIIDFNNSTIYMLNDAEDDAIKINGSNIILKNLILEEKNYNYVSDAHGISFEVSKNINNVSLENITTNGFLNGIYVRPTDGYIASDIYIKDCITKYASSAGISISNSTNIVVENHISKYNKFDGLKTSKNVNGINIIGGDFSYNVDPTATYADGIDLYAGGSYVNISGVKCDYNGGVGLHILSGELNDVNYQNPVWGIIKNIIISNSFFRNNTSAGMDCTIKTSVSATTPQASKVYINNCISELNEYGFQITNSRNINISNCLARLNSKDGYTITTSWYVNLYGCDSICNSQSGAGGYPGVKITSCNQIKIFGGVINGVDADTTQNADDSSLTKYHVHGINVEGTSDCDDILIEYPTIRNYTGFRQVNISDNATNADKKIRVHLLDVGTDSLSSYEGYYGSTLYKDNYLYEKHTDLSSSTWKIKLDLYGSVTWDPGDLADGVGETSSSITVTGAVLGDYVAVSAPYDLQGCIAHPYVDATNSVKIRLQNGTGGNVNLASGTWKVKVIKS
jgi:hypothetical protein